MLPLTTDSAPLLAAANRTLVYATGLPRGAAEDFARFVARPESLR
ncbi:hypothetical protein [Streptomyces sp. NBC_01483]|nr:hypothetical protein [Streptomyces sp. NBC_01483]